MRRHLRAAAAPGAAAPAPDQLWAALLPYDARLRHGLVVLHDLDGRVLAASAEAQVALGVWVGGPAPAHVWADEPGSPTHVLATGSDGVARALRVVPEPVVPPDGGSPRAILWRYAVVAEVRPDDDEAAADDDEAVAQ